MQCKVVCPVCGEVAKTYSINTFRHCGAQYSVEANLLAGEQAKYEKMVVKEKGSATPEKPAVEKPVVEKTVAKKPVAEKPATEAIIEEKPPEVVKPKPRKPKKKSEIEEKTKPEPENFNGNFGFF